MSTGCMRHYRIEHDGANDRKALKRILEANLDKYKLPAYVTFAAGGEELNYLRRRVKHYCWCSISAGEEICSG